MKYSLPIFLLLFSIQSFSQIEVIRKNQDDSIHVMATWKNRLYFVTSSQNREHKIWISEGTQASTAVLKNIGPALSQFYSRPVFYAFDNYLLFTLQTGTNSFELWKTNGTANGTELLTTLSKKPERFTPFQSSIAFATADEFWKTDLTPAGTIRLGTFPFITDILFYQTKLWLLTYNQAWTSDGTVAGTTQIIQRPVNIQSFNYARFYAYRDTIYILFRHCCDPATSLLRVEWDGTSWKTAPAGMTTPQVFDHFVFKDKLIVGAVAPGRTTVFNPDTKNWDTLAKGGNQFYGNPSSFFFQDNYFLYLGQRNSIIKSDGTPGGTEELVNVPFSGDDMTYDGISHYAINTNSLYFAAKSTNNRQDLYRANLNNKSHVLIRRFGFDPPSQLILSGDTLFVRKRDSVFITYSSRNSLASISHLFSTAHLKSISEFISYRGKLYFGALLTSDNQYALGSISAGGLPTIPEPETELEPEIQFKVGPNPSYYGSVGFTASANGIVKVFDFNGREVHEEKITANEITFIQTYLWRKGIYFLSFTTRDRRVKRFKIMVNN